MRFPTIWFSFSMLLIFLLASGASAINIDVSVGNGNIAAITNNAYDKDTTFVEQTIKANPLDASLSNSLSGGGSLPGAIRSIRDAKGNYAETYRSVTGSPSTTWTYQMSTGTDGMGVKAEEWLTVKNAYSISAYGSASNAEGDQAKASITNSHSSPSVCLTNWYTKAHADSSLVSAYQSADSAYSGASSGKPSGTVKFDTLATNKETDWAEAYTTAAAGYAQNYRANAQSGVHYAQADIYNLQASTLSYADGGSIYNEMYARHIDNPSSTADTRDVSWVDLSIAGNYYWNKYLSTFPYNSAIYPAHAYSSKYSDITRASQSEFQPSYNGNAGTERAYAFNYGHGGWISTISGYKVGTSSWTGPTSPYSGVKATNLA
jgi:hypothetical protein